MFKLNFFQVLASILSRNVILVPLSVLFCVLPAQAHSADSISALLSKSAQAAELVSYKGTFIYSNGMEPETMRVYRLVSSSGFHERIQSLNGDSSEIVRNSKGVWCYFPDRKEGFFKFRDDELFRMPKIDAALVPELQKYYLITIVGRERIANRWTNQLKFMPKDSYRYGVNLWIDAESGLLLRSDLFNKDQEVIDWYAFVDIALNEEIHVSDLMPTESGTDYLWNFSSEGEIMVTDASTPLSITLLPDGFKKIKHVRTQSEEEEKEQIVFTDDLATVSLFMQKLNQDKPDGYFVGSSQLGAVNAYGRVIDGYQVTVVGEVPFDTVRAIGESIEIRN